MSRRWGAALASSFSLAAAQPASDAAALLRAADAARTSLEEGVVRLRVARSAGPGHEADEIDLYVGGPHRALAVFRSGRQEGRRLLVVEGASWLLVPGARHAIAIAGQHRLAGELAIADLAGRPLAGRYEPSLRPATEEVNGAACRVLELAAAAPGDPHPSAVLWVGAADGLPRRLVLLLPSGREAREIVFDSFRSERDRKVADRLRIRDLLRPGAETRVEFLGYQPQALEPSIFTVEGARSLP